MSMPVITYSNVPREQAISDIIQSVALEETGLSHILNAEGEKIQKVVANGTIAQMLDVNKSVKSVIDAISLLETVLHMKLDLFSCQICHRRVDQTDDIS